MRWADAAASLRVDAALEPLGRLAGQLVPAGGAGDRDRVEVRGLEDQVVVRSVLDGRRLAAHDPGQGDRPRVVGDHQVLGVERARDVVERAQLLAGRARRTTIGPSSRLAVEGVQRLARSRASRSW